MQSKIYCYNKQNAYNQLHKKILSNNLNSEINNNWNVYRFEISEYYKTYDSIIKDFYSFLENGNTQNFILKDNTYSGSITSSISRKLILNIIISKYKNKPDYLIIKNFLNVLDNQELLYWGLFLYFNITTIKKFEEGLQYIGKFNCINYLDEYYKIFLILYIIYNRQNINLYTDYTFADFIHFCDKLDSDQLSSYLLFCGMIDFQKHSLLEIADYFDVDSKSIRNILKQTKSIIATNTYLHKTTNNKSHYYNKNYHKIKLKITDNKILESIIITDILYIQKMTDKYITILFDIIQDNIISNIVTIHKQYSLAYFRSLLLLQYNEYKIIEYNDSLKELYNYNTIYKTALTFDISINDIKDIITKFQSYFCFFKEYYNDIPFTYIPL